MILDLLLPLALHAHRPGVDAAAVLHAWDARRAAAWSDGDVAALQQLYAPGSAAGRADIAMLRAWADRGVRVGGMRMQLLRIDVRQMGPKRLVLTVTDRLVAAVAVRGAWRHELPRDEPSTRWLTLVRGDDGWRVAQASPVRTTS